MQLLIFILKHVNIFLDLRTLKTLLPFPEVRSGTNDMISAGTSLLNINIFYTHTKSPRLQDMTLPGLTQTNLQLITLLQTYAVSGWVHMFVSAPYWFVYQLSKVCYLAMTFRIRNIVITKKYSNDI